MPKVSEAYLEERRQQILDAAMACFARKGFHQTTMEEIGQEAGVSPGVAYRYFDSKEAIIQATLREGNDEQTALRLQTMFDEADNLLHLLDTAIRYWFARFESPETDAVMKVRVQGWAEALQNQQVKAQVMGRWRDHLALDQQWVRRAQEGQEIDPNLDPEAVARAIQSLFDGLTLQWAIDPNMDTEHYREAMMAMIAGLFTSNKPAIHE